MPMNASRQSPHRATPPPHPLPHLRAYADGRGLAIAALCVPLMGCAAPPVPTLMPASACPAGEPAVLACQVTTGQVLALCGKLPDTLQYRFGPARKPELVFPANPADGLKLLHYAHMWRAQAEREEVTFETGGWRYVVFDYSEEDVRLVGVNVVPSAGGSTRNWLCTGAVHGDLTTLASHLPCDPQSALQGELCR